MRSIRVGDKVQAFLDPKIAGVVVNILREDSDTWLVGGTVSTVTLCDVQTADGKTVRVKMTDVFITDI